MLLLQYFLKDFNKKFSYRQIVALLTLFRMGISGLLTDGGDQKAPLPKICRTYPTMMKLDIVIPYIKKIQKIYESRDNPPEFC